MHDSTTKMPEIDAAPPAPPDPGPAAVGVVCPRCRGTRFKTTWQVFSDGSRHVRMTCAACNKFMRYLPRPDGPDLRLERRPHDARAYRMKPPPASYNWIGFIRQSDELWRAVALAPTLERCWDCLLTYPGDGDLLCVPSEPPPQRNGGASP
jgi:hypothetical protein